VPSLFHPLPDAHSSQSAELAAKRRIFDNLTRLKLWTETAANTSFLQDKLGLVDKGFAGGFLAWERNALGKWQKTQAQLRFKQGAWLEQ
jgi:hypothetical protein